MHRLFIVLTVFVLLTISALAIMTMPVSAANTSGALECPP
jgi:hypothetical protein